MRQRGRTAAPADGDRAGASSPSRRHEAVGVDAGRHDVDVRGVLPGPRRQVLVAGDHRARERDDRAASSRRSSASRSRGWHRMSRGSRSRRRSRRSAERAALASHSLQAPPRKNASRWTKNASMRQVRATLARRRSAALRGHERLARRGVAAVEDAQVVAVEQPVVADLDAAAGAGPAGRPRHGSAGPG